MMMMIEFGIEKHLVEGVLNVEEFDLSFYFLDFTFPFPHFLNMSKKQKHFVWKWVLFFFIIKIVPLKNKNIVF